MLKFIGRGSAFNVKEHNTSAFHKYNDGKSMLLIDCGETVFKDIIELNLLSGVSELEVLITHTHPDHIGSLGSLIFYAHYENIKVKILKTLESINIGVHSILSNNGVPNTMYDFVDSIPYVKEYVKVSHVQDLESVMYVIQGFSNKTLIYTGDTNDIRAVCDIYKKCSNSTVFVDTCFKEYTNNPHLSIDILIRNIKPKDRKDFYCMHIDSPDLFKTIRDTGFNVVYSAFRCNILNNKLNGISICHLVDNDKVKYMCIYDEKLQYKGRLPLAQVRLEII